MIKVEYTPPSQKQIEKLIQAYKERLRTVIIERLTAIGKESVKIARELPDKGGTYHNRTGQLHNSIGFLITENGQPVAEDFISSEGRRCAMQQEARNQDGFVLIIVAGAEYALDVHVRGYDVLDSAIINAESQIKEFCDKIRGI